MPLLIMITGVAVGPVVLNVFIALRQLCRRRNEYLQTN
jgi:hypothetical protein